MADEKTVENSSNAEPGAPGSSVEQRAKERLARADEAQLRRQKDSAGVGLSSKAKKNDKPAAKRGKSASSPKKTQRTQTASHPVGFIRQFELVDLVKAYDPQADEDLLNRAYVLAMQAHGGQTRKSGDPYFTHPLAVAAILTELRADPATVATALLHDVVEDTDVSIDDIHDLFGEEIKELVDGVTKLAQIEQRSAAEKQAENFRKFVMAMAKDVRVLLVKLADRLHNMRTLHHFDKAEKRRRIALETMEIYAPLAGRIGVYRIQEELEDISFKELSPEAYETISTRLEDLERNTISSVVDLANVLRLKLSSAGIDVQVYSRQKRPYSIWRKMAKKNVSFDELADIYAFRCLVGSLEDCYKALGVIHTNWRIIPEEFDDYISAEKPNGYRSIHTVVVGPPSEDGRRQRIEIQIRTHEMHETAERGIAAHWQYKDPGTAQGRPGVEIVTSGASHDPYDTMKRLVEMYQHGEDPAQALKYAKMELFQDQVFCFTPKGRVIALPKGATAIDFAYAVHTDVGDSCIGVNINGVARPLRRPLRSGDVVHILRSENAPVPAEWESIVTTGRARSAIRRRIKKMVYEDQVALGRAITESVLTGANLSFSHKAIRAALSRLDMQSVDDVFANVGRGDISVNDLIEAIYPGAEHHEGGEVRAGVMANFRPRAAIDGLTPSVPVRMSLCCTPLPDERIVGIKVDGEIQVHTIYCEELAAHEDSQERWLDLKWRDKDEAAVSGFARILINVQNGTGVLSEVASIISRYGVSIANIALRNRSQEFIDLFIDVEVKDLRQLTQTMAGVRALDRVLSVQRIRMDEEHEPRRGS